MTNTIPRTAVVAVGGNALILDKQHEDVASQVERRGRDLQAHRRHDRARLERDRDARQRPAGRLHPAPQRAGRHEVHSTPLDVIGADTQGAIGYMIARALDNEFTQRGIKRSVAAVVTQVLVDRNDPGFKNPTKGIGGFTTKEKAEKFEAKAGS